MPKLIDSGIYIIELVLKSNVTITHPKFTDFIFPPSYYYYVGSAQKNLSARILRHLKKDKKLHWHIDYLTSNKNVMLSRAFIIEGNSKNEECILVSKLLKTTKMIIAAENFGNSDCRNCKSHLLKSSIALDYNHLLSLYQATVLFIPSSKLIC